MVAEAVADLRADGHMDRRTYEPLELPPILAHSLDAVCDGVGTGMFTTPVPVQASRAVLAMCQAAAQWYRPDGLLNPSRSRTTTSPSLWRLSATGPDRAGQPAPSR